MIKVKRNIVMREMKTTREFKRHLVPLQSSASGFTYSVTIRKWELRAWGETRKQEGCDNKVTRQRLHCHREPHMV